MITKLFDLYLQVSSCIIYCLLNVLRFSIIIYSFLVVEITGYLRIILTGTVLLLIFSIANLCTAVLLLYFTQWTTNIALYPEFG